jgi:tetratricopeptide (TPR) repeat protein
LAKEGRWEDAIGRYQACLRFFIQTQDMERTVAAANNLGLALTELGRWSEAYTYFRQALDSQDSRTLPEARGDILNNLAIVERELGHRAKECQALQTLGVAFADQGLWGEAFRCLRRALEIHEELGDRGTIANIENGLGLLHLKRGAWTEAEAHFRSSLGSYQELGDPPARPSFRARPGWDVPACAGITARRPRPRSAAGGSCRSRPRS